MPITGQKLTNHHYPIWTTKFCLHCNFLTSSGTVNKEVSYECTKRETAATLAEASDTWCNGLTFHNTSIMQNLPRQEVCLHCIKRLHITQCFINFSRCSIIFDRAHDNGLILAKHNSHTVTFCCQTGSVWVRQLLSLLTALSCLQNSKTVQFLSLIHIWRCRRRG